MPELFVTNFNRNFTGVSATAANVIRAQAAHHDLRLVGYPLPGCPDPVTVAAARRLCRTPPPDRPFAIWHVRRNPEMRSAIWARDVLRLPIRIVFTSAAQRWHSAYPRWLISRMDAVIATTAPAAGFVPHLRAVVPHGVDCALFSPAPDRGAAWRALGLGGCTGIATIGRIRPEKGTDRFVRAMLRVLPDHPGLVALVVGRAAREHAAFAEGLKAEIRAAGLADRILFTGECAPADLPALLRALSLVVQLPRYEGYGMVPLEGMASGVPFVAARAGHFDDFSGGGTAGLVVAQDDAPDAAATAIHALLVEPDRHLRMSRAARALAESQFSAEAEAQGIEAVYQSLWTRTH